MFFLLNSQQISLQFPGFCFRIPFVLVFLSDMYRKPLIYSSNLFRMFLKYKKRLPFVSQEFPNVFF